MALVENTQHTRTITDRQDAGSQDTFNSYLCDIRSYNHLTYTEEIDLARQAVAGNEPACSPTRSEIFEEDAWMCRQLLGINKSLCI
jgi:hypothetical protein